MSVKYGDIVEQSPEAITMISREYVYEIANESYCRTLQRARAEIVGAHVSHFWGADKFEHTIKSHLDRCFTGERVHYEEHLQSDSDDLYLHVSFYPYGENHNPASHALVFSTDVTQIRNLER